MNWTRVTAFLIVKAISCAAFLQSSMKPSGISPLLLSNPGLGKLTSAVPPARSCGLSAVAGQSVGTAVGGELGAKLGSVLGILLGNGLGVGLGELFGALAGAEIGGLTGQSVCISGVSCPIKKQLCPQCQITPQALPLRPNVLKAKCLPNNKAVRKLPKKGLIPTAGIIPNIGLKPNAGAFLSGGLIPNTCVLPSIGLNSYDSVLPNPNLITDASLQPNLEIPVDDVSIDTLALTDASDLPDNINTEAEEEALIAAFEQEFAEALNEATENELKSYESVQVQDIENNELSPNNQETVETLTTSEADCASIPVESVPPLSANTYSVNTLQPTPFQENKLDTGSNGYENFIEETQGDINQSIGIIDIKDASVSSLPETGYSPENTLISEPVNTDGTLLSETSAYTDFYGEAQGDINQSFGTIDTNAYLTDIKDASQSSLPVTDYSLPETGYSSANTLISEPVNTDGTVLSEASAYKNFCGEAQGDINQSFGTIDTDIKDASLSSLPVTDYSLPVPENLVPQYGTVVSGSDAYENFIGETPITEPVTNDYTTASVIDSYTNPNLESATITNYSSSIPSPPAFGPQTHSSSYRPYSSYSNTPSTLGYSEGPKVIEGADAKENSFGKTPEGIRPTYANIPTPVPSSEGTTYANIPTPVPNYAVPPSYTQQSYYSTYRNNAYNSYPGYTSSRYPTPYYPQYPPQQYPDYRASSYRY